MEGECVVIWKKQNPTGLEPEPSAGTRLLDYLAVVQLDRQAEEEAFAYGALDFLIDNPRSTEGVAQPLHLRQEPVESRAFVVFRSSKVSHQHRMPEPMPAVD